MAAGRRGEGARALVAALVAVLAGVVLWVGPSPSGARARVLWTGSEVPADLVQEAEPDLGTNIDAGARAFAAVDSPGPVDPEGCATVSVDPSVVGFFVPRGETVPTRFVDGQLCELGAGAQELRLTGETLSADQEAVLGSARARFYRTAASEPFSRFDLEMTDGRCFAVGSLSGYPGDGTSPDDYVMQGWNYEASPAVDCASRSLDGPPPTSEPPLASSTTAVVATTAPSTTTSAVQPPGDRVGATPATPQAGTPTYAG